MITQKWEGYVHEIDLFAGEFSAVSQDLTDPNTPQEYATFKISDMPERAQGNLKLGMVFNWTIEVDDNEHGTSTFKFSEEKWTAEEIAEIDREAKRLHDEWNSSTGI